MGVVRDPVRASRKCGRAGMTTSGLMRADYTRLVSIANAGAKELGYRDVGIMWRSGYDMSDEEFARELDRLWTQVKPLYDQLHQAMSGRS